MSFLTPHRFFWAVGAFLIGLHFCFFGLSHQFPYGVDPRGAPTVAFVALAMAAGFCLPVLLTVIGRLTPSRRALLAVFAAGIVMRLVLTPSTPILEDDWHRYLWDGATVAAGIDPYVYAPAEAASRDAFGKEVEPSGDPNLATLRRLAEAHGDVHERINFPYVKTIYPPVSQLAFLAANQIEPFSLIAWRLVLLLVDCAAFAILVVALRAYGQNPLWAALYWWNPVVTVQTFNAGHMDVVVVPFLVATLVCSRIGRSRLAAATLAIAAAVKIWPVVLLPALMRPHFDHRKRLAQMAAIFTGLGLVLMAPQLAHLSDADAGLAVYADSWQRNAFLFTLFQEGLRFVSADPGAAARVMAALIVVSIALLAAWHMPKDGAGLPAAMLVAASALFFLSPTGYPWYLIWIAPLLCFARNVGLSVMMATAPLYYLRFVLGDDSLFFQWFVVPVQFGLPLLILTYPFMRHWSFYGKPAHP